MLMVLWVHAQTSLNVSVTVLVQPVREMLCDSTRLLLLLAIPGNDLTSGNSIGFFDPTLLSITDVVFVGSEPGPIDITDDGAFAYVGLNGSGLVRKVDLNSMSVLSSVHMGYYLNAFPLRAWSVAAKPGTDEVFAVIKAELQEWVDPEGVDVYASGVPLIGQSGLSSGDDVRFKPNAPDRLVLVEYAGAQSKISTIAVEDEGLVFLNSQVGLFTGSSGRVSVSGDLALTDDGTLFDIAQDVPVVLGSCTLPPVNLATRACLDPYEDRICVAFRDPLIAQRLRVMRFDRATFQAVDQFEVELTSPIARIGQILCWGPGTRYVVSVDDEELIVVDGVNIGTAVPQWAQETPWLNREGDYLIANENGPVRFDLCDVQGRVLRVSDGSGRLPIGGVAVGTYLVRFYSGTRPIGVRKWFNAD